MKHATTVTPVAGRLRRAMGLRFRWSVECNDLDKWQTLIEKEYPYLRRESIYYGLSDSYVVSGYAKTEEEAILRMNQAVESYDKRTWELLQKEITIPLAERLEGKDSNDN